MEGFVYIVRYWVDFPTSEYGGLVIISAKNDEEAVQFLIDLSQGKDRDAYLGYGSDEQEAILRIPMAVSEAVKVKMDASECGQPPKLLKKFTT